MYNVIQFIQTSAGLTVLTLASFFLDNDVRNIRMLNNVTFNFSYWIWKQNYIKFYSVVIIVLIVFPLLTNFY